MKLGCVQLYMKNSIDLDMVPFDPVNWRYVILNYSDYSGRDDELKAKITNLVDLATESKSKCRIFRTPIRATISQSSTTANGTRNETREAHQRYEEGHNCSCSGTSG